MKHDYNSHSIPSPVIKDAMQAVEDATGNLTTTKNLIDVLIGQIETMTDTARKPGVHIDAEAQRYSLDGLWTIAETIAERMKNDIILLEAVYMHDDPGFIAEDASLTAGTHPTPARGSVLRQHLDRLKWSDAIDAVEAAIKSENEKGVSEEETDARTGLTAALAIVMFNMPAPDLTQLARKAEVAKYLQGTSEIGNGWDTIIADMLALAQPRTIRGSTAQEASTKQA